MEPQVRLLRSGEIRRASFLLAEAFAADPFIGHFFNHRRRRELALPRFFRAVLHEFADGRALYALEDGATLAGVAAWMPPEGVKTGPRSRRLSRFASWEVRVLFPRAAPRLLAGFDTLGQRHPEQPHWYLAFVGIDPRRQRGGFGSKLLAPALELVDAAGVACYLETPFPDTRAFYRRLGFEETSELRPVIGAPIVYTMIRPAAPHRSTTE